MLNVGLLRVAEQVYWPQIISSSFPNEGFRSAKRYKFSLEPSLSVSHRPDTTGYLPSSCDILFVLVSTLLYILGFLVRFHGEELFHFFLESKHYAFVCFKIGSSNGERVNL